MSHKEKLSEFISEKYFSGSPVKETESLFFSGLIDSLGIQEVSLFLSEISNKNILGTDIVENDLDTINLLMEWISDE